MSPEHLSSLASGSTREALCGSALRPAPLLLLIGIPGSGKSTVAAKLMGRQPALIVSTDAVRGQLFGDEAIQGDWSLIWQAVQRQLRQGIDQIQQGQIQRVIYDATNAARRDRRRLLLQLRAIGFTDLTGLWLDTPYEVCLARNRSRDRQVPEAVMARMQRRLMGAPPSLGEGFDRLIQYSQLGTADNFGTAAAWRSACQNRDRESTDIAIALSATTEPR